MIIEKSWIKREKEYYSDKSNFIACNGEITYLKYNNGSTYLGMNIDKLYNFSDGTFKLNYENSLIVKELGFENDIHLGDKISFISAPKYFGDG